MTTSVAGDRDHRIDHRFEHGAIMHIRRCQHDRERNLLRVGEQMVLRARLAAIRRIRAGGRAPFFRRDTAGIQRRS